MGVVEALRRWWHTFPMPLRVCLGKRLRFLIDPVIVLGLPKAVKDQVHSFRSVAILGAFSSPIGHGIAAKLLEYELRAGGVSVRKIDASKWIGAPIDPKLAIRSEELAPDDVLIVALNPDVAIHALAKMGKEKLRNRKIIGYWVWELEVVPAFWKLAGRFAHEIWTPSTFSANALKKLFDVPVHVVPHPVALLPPPEVTAERRARSREALGISDSAFVAIQSFSLASSLTRKNAIGAISAFVAAFHDQPDARLILRHLSGDRFPDSLHRLREAAQVAGPQIILRPAGDGLEDLHDLYAACDVYISLHRTEGFGLNLAEIMLAGRPLIATKWSGNLDFMDNKCVALVNADLVALDDPDKVYTQKAARWAEPRMDEAIRWLQTLARNPDQRLKLAEAGKTKAMAVLGGRAIEVLHGVNRTDMASPEG
jgi:glycosyltransferase involved in cell wall biosynthesis